MQTEKADKDTRKARKSALGRGLAALLPDSEEMDETIKDYFMCDVSSIQPNPYQPRTQFPEEEMRELADSIREQGVIQPLLVRNTEAGYELVAGERRLRAARMAGLEFVPVVVKDVSEKELLEISIVENIQRADLNPIEESESYHRLMTEFKLTQEEVADRVGKSRPAVANFLRLKNLPMQIKETILNNTISMGHARALLGADTPAQMSEAWRIVVSKSLSVRETEKLIKRMKAERDKPPPPEPGPEENYFTSVSEELSRHLGTRVQIMKSGKKGKMTIEFYGNEDLDRLLTILKPV